VPVRVNAGAFEFTRAQRKCLARNSAVEAFEVPARATTEQFALFQRYQAARHGDGDMAGMGFYDYRAMVEDTPIETMMIEFRDADDALVAACLADRLSDGLSAVYSFFDPGQSRRSLGTMIVLWLVGRARELKLPFVYLGYWVETSRKMAYKARFQETEILVGGVWRPLAQPSAETALALAPPLEATSETDLIG
jgi:arginine-tRNA-protein transferase